MRNQLRLLLLRRSTRHASTNTISHFPSPPHHSIPSLSFLHTTQRQHFYAHENYAAIRCFSSEPEKKIDAVKQCLVDVFSAERSSDEIEKGLDMGGVSVTHELVLDALRDLGNRPEVATRFFNWLLANHGQLVSSKTYNFVLGILGSNGLTTQFWDLVDDMKKKGFGVKKGAYDKAMAKFEKEGFSEDLKKLSDVYASGSTDNSVEKLGVRAARIVRNTVWDENVESQLRDLFGGAFNTDNVVTVLEKVGVTEPLKALIFFRWLEESGLFKHDSQSYNSMLLVLSREDSVDRFWKIATEMRGAGYELELDSYVKISDRFHHRKMIKELVDLYEFSMGGAIKPPSSDVTFLLRKIVTDKKFDMSLFSKVVKIYTEADNKLTQSSATAVFKSLTSVGRLTNCNKILDAMKEGGLEPEGSLRSKIAFQLGCRKKGSGVDEFMEKYGASETAGSIRTWTALIEGNCVSGDLEKALNNFHKMIHKEGVTNSGYAFNLLVDAHCRRNKAKDACKLLTEMIDNKKIEPWHDTYKILITSLLAQNGFSEALNLLGLMKSHGFPPYIEPFIKFISKSGSADDAYNFLRAMSVKQFPSTLVVIKLFKALFVARKHSVAHDLLSKCPGYIRTDADILNLFYSKRKSAKVSSAPSELTTLAA